MNTILVIGLVLAVLLVGAGVAIVYYNSTANTGSSAGTTTSQTETTTQQPQTTTTTKTTGVDLSGTWEGTFTAQNWKGTSSTGRWTWIIHRVDSNKYAGVLKTMDTYPTGGYIDIEVTVDGNKITIGTVGNNAGMAAVVFTGTVSSDGTQASGTWHFSNNMDNGQWSGRKTSSSTQIPVETTATTKTSTNPTTTQTSTTTTITSTTAPSTCVPNPPAQYQAAFQSMYQAAITVFGESNMKCYFQGTVEPQYVVAFHLLNYNEQEALNYAEQLNTALRNDGWITSPMVATNNEIHVGGAYNTTVNGEPVMLVGIISIAVEQNGTTHLAIQIQPATP